MRPSSELLGLAREALSNVTRHSGATTVTLALAGVDARVLLTVEDDGVGFDPMRTYGPEHQGLTNMRERAALLGGTLRIEQPATGRHARRRAPSRSTASPSMTSDRARAGPTARPSCCGC